MRRTRTVIIACALITAACTDTNDQPTATPTTSDSSASTPAPSTAPTKPAPPELPAVARRKTTAGAKAFVAYYIDTINYSFMVPTTAGLVDVSPKDCVLCQSFLKVLRQMVRDGGDQTGGEWAITSLVMVARESPDSLVFISEIRVSAGTSRRREGAQPHDIKSRQITMEVHAVWRKGSWTLMNAAPA